RARLTRRGLAVSARMLAALSADLANGVVRAKLLETAIRMGLHYAAGRPVVPRVEDLADSVVKTGTLIRWALAGAGAVAGAVLLAICLLVALLPWGAGRDGAPAPVAGPPAALPAEPEKLQGNWDVIAIEKQGQAKLNAGMRVVFAADTMSVFTPGAQSPPMPYVFDSSKVPKTIDVNAAFGGVWRGIYELN